MSGPLSPAMSRLFDQSDIEFLRAAPGYSRRAESDFRRRRCQIFRHYLRSLHDALEETLADLDGLGASPLQWRLQLAAAMIPAGLHLLRYRFGWGDVPLADIVRRFDRLLAEARIDLSTNRVGKYGAVPFDTAPRR